MAIKLETERLILRPLRNSDSEDLVEGAGNLNIAKMVENIPYPYKKSDALWFIDKSKKNFAKKEPSDYIFGIELKSEKKIIGIMHLAKVDKYQGTAETGSWINEKYWKKGYITEAKIAVNEFAFNELNLRKINSSVFVGNIASNKTQQRMGYKKEGLKRKDSKNRATGEIKDVILYGLMKEDWKKNLSKLRKYLKDKIKMLKK